MTSNLTYFALALIFYFQENEPTKKVTTSRRRPATVVRSMPSSSLAEKYDLMADIKTIVAKQKLKEIQQRMEFEKTEHNLRLQNLEIDLEIKKEQLHKLKHT